MEVSIVQIADGVERLLYTAIRNSEVVCYWREVNVHRYQEKSPIASMHGIIWYTGNI